MQESDPQKEIISIQQQLSRLRAQQQEQDAAILRLQQRLQQLALFLQDKQEIPDKATLPVIEAAEIPVPLDPPPSGGDVRAATRSQPPAATGTSSFNWEKFIGENLINKIGIVILVIGVIIGAKYAIDKDLISPAMRIITGYIIGAGLLVFAYRLKKNYTNFSAVLLGGAMTSLYFLTYAAHTHYRLLSLPTAFVLMLLLTIFTVLAALQYRKEIISVLGMVGAYALPLLLGEDSGTPVLLLSYIAIINFGIYYIVCKKHWYSSLLLASVTTWMALLAWYFLHSDTTYTSTLLCFSGIFFLQSAVTLMVLFNNVVGRPHPLTIISLVQNALFFFGAGYVLTEACFPKIQLTGLFTVLNATFYLCSAYFFSKKVPGQLAYYLFLSLGLSFLTISIPIQFNGYFVTLLWLTESLLFLWTARKKALPFLEKLSYIVFVLGCLSLLSDWLTPGFITSVTAQWPVFNHATLSATAAGLLVFSHIWALQKYPVERPVPLRLVYMLCGIVIIYITGTIEIATYTTAKKLATYRLYNQTDLQLADAYFRYYSSLSATWLMIYNFIFLSITGFLCIRYSKQRTEAVLQLSFGYLLLLVFLIIGLYHISELRMHFLNGMERTAFPISFLWLALRYSCIALAAVLLIINARLQRFYLPGKSIGQAISLIAYTTAIWILSSELIQWLDIAGYKYTYKLGLSILWGSCSLYLIYIGIFRSKSYLRIAAMVLFGVTLLKLFFYDLAHLHTLSKTIIFIILGILLLIISFLYNKYRHLIHPEDKTLPDDNTNN